MVSHDPFDDPRLRLDSDETGELLHPRSEQRRSDKRRREFLAPVPLQWLCRATPLPGKALAVAVALWFRAGRTKRKRVRLSWSLLTKFGIEPDAGNRGLRALEAAGLVQSHRHRGCCPMVTLLEGDERAEQAIEQSEEGRNAGG